MAIYIAYVANSEIEIEDVLAVSISDQRYKHRYSGKDDIEKYVSLVLDAKDNALQTVEDDANSYIIEFEMKNGSNKTYRFYPTLRGDSLLQDGSGTIKTAKDVSELLLRVEYEDVFQSRYLPQMSVRTIDGEKSVSPKAYVWSFKKTTSDFFSFDDEKVTTEVVELGVSADALKKGPVSFSVAPDEYRLAYTVDGNSYSKLENLSLKDGQQVEITVYALWKKTSEGMFHGEGEWKFKAIYKESPMVSIDKTEVSLGDCIVLYAENIDAGEKISVKTDIATCKTPTVYEGESKNYALLPIDVKTAGGEYTIKVSYRDAEFSFGVNIKEFSNGFFIKNVNAETYNSVTSPTGIEEYENFISSLVDKSADTYLWENKKLIKPVDAEAEVSFASQVLYNGLPPQVYFEGHSYPVAKKTSVKSAAKGKVVFAGETAKTGKAVVIDHGCGIMTHYYHLSVISALEGEEIEAGKLIALSGNSGFTDKDDLFFAVSINGVFVNPQLFLE